MKIFFLVMLFLVPVLASTQDNILSEIEWKEAQGLYKKNCSTCHGRKGGLGLAGATNLKTSTISSEEITSIIKKGRGAMTPFEEKLTAEEIELIAQYLFTLRKKG